MALTLTIKLPCANLEQLVGRYGNELAQGLLFVRAIKPRAVGTLVRLELMLSDGGPCLRAAATVSRVVEEPATAAGMELKLLAVDAEGRAILSGLNGPKLRPLKLESFGTPGSARSDPLAPSPILSLAPPAKANRPASINVPAPISPAAPAIPNAAIPLPPPAARKAAPILGLDLGGMNLRAAAMQDGRAQQIASTRRAARDESIARPLNELKELAAVRLQAVVSRAVIAVPASYRAPQREMVRMTSGLSVERIVSAPIAAALLFAHGKGLERRVLVYDLGANRFDATLVEIRGNTYEAIAIRSDETASGNTIDASLAAWLLEQFLEKHGVGLSGDPVIAERLTRAAERAKILLSEQLSAQIHEAGLISRDGKPRTLEAFLSRTELVLRAGPVIDRTIELCRELMLSKKFASSDLNEVLLIGAQSKMPLVRERLRQFFGVEPATSIDPEQAAVQGAALLALEIESGSSEAPILIDAAPFPVLHLDTPPPPERAQPQVPATPTDLFQMVSAPPAHAPAKLAPVAPPAPPAAEEKKGWLSGIFGKKKK
jgi:hypothetical protein